MKSQCAESRSLWNVGMHSLISYASGGGGGVLEVFLVSVTNVVVTVVFAFNYPNSTFNYPIQETNYPNWAFNYPIQVFNYLLLTAVQ